MPGLLPRALAALTCLVLLCSPLRAEPPTAEERVAEAIAAFEAGDDARLGAVAATPDIDPWLLANRLHGRGRLDVARALAARIEGPVGTALAAHLASLEDREFDAATWQALEAYTQAMRARDAAAAAKALAIEAEPSPIVAVLLGQARADLARRERRLDEAGPLLATAAARARSVGWVRRAMEIHHDATMVAVQRGDMRGALEDITAMRELADVVGADDARLQALQLSAAIKGQIAPLREEAVREFEQALALLTGPGHRALRARVLNNLAGVLEDMDRLPEARRHAEASLAIKQELDDPLSLAATLSTLGGIIEQENRPDEALELFDRSLAIAREHMEIHRAGDPIQFQRAARGAAIVAYRRAFALRFVARYGEALDAYDAAQHLGMEARDIWTVADSLREGGYVLRALGRPAAARERYAQALSLYERLQDRQRMAITHQALGTAWAKEGEKDRALEAFAKAAGIFRELGADVGLAHVLASQAGLREGQGEDAEALRLYNEALRLAESSAREDVLGEMLVNRGRLRLADDLEGARQDLERALPMLEAVYMPDARARAHAALARLHRASGRPAKAVEEARRGVAVTAHAQHGLAPQEAAALRSYLATLFAEGTAAAIEAGDRDALFWFLEAGRGQVLAASLGSREALREVTTPPELRAAEAEARRRLRGADDRLRSARRFRDIRRAKQALEQSKQALADVLLRIERRARQAADSTHPTPVTLAEAQALVPPAAALVLYGTTPEAGVAMVLRRDAVRIVRLAPGPELARLAQALDLSQRDTAPASALADLRAALLDPLGLDDATRRVIVSAPGALAYVPFSALDPAREFVATPSATTLGILAAMAQGTGRRVLAVGDPDYGVRPKGASAARQRFGTRRALPALPATRTEVEAVGDEKLLGREASEARVRRALADRPEEGRWRAVHFACHGLVDMERPEFSSLALTASAENDGFLTAEEVARLEIPADLVVLSACETARGKVFAAEGIFGLTRAFMFAGAGRVLCSLWKVDDAATQALMVEFYRRWRGEDGLDAAGALRAAQAHVRSRAGWEHPYFWAAWVLWGLPD